MNAGKGGALWPLKGSVLFLLLQVCGRRQQWERPGNPGSLEDPGVIPAECWALKAQKLPPQGPQLGGVIQGREKPGGRAWDLGKFGRRALDVEARRAERLG